MKRKFMVGVLSASLLLGGGVITQAGTTWQNNISVYVPNHNGSAATKYQTKATSSARAGLQLNATQGVELDVRAEGSNGAASWVRNVKGGNTYSLPSVTVSGNNERLRFSSNLFESQNVNAILNWRSN